MKSLKGLTYQQHRFCELYLKGTRQGLAYAEAYGVDNDTKEGYMTAAVSASELLKNPKIMTHIDRVLTRRFKLADVKAYRILAELMNIGLADVRLLFNETGTLKSMDELTIQQQAAIMSVETKEIETNTGPTIIERKVKFHSKTKALELLCKNLGLLQENQAKTDVKVDVHNHVYPQNTYVFQDIKQDDNERETSIQRVHAN